MSEINDQIRRCFVIAYARVFLDEVERLAESYCPEGCNYIDEATLDWIYRPDKQPNFRSWTAYDLFEFAAHLSVSRVLILNAYYAEALKCDLSDEDANSVFYKWGDPFLLAMCNWNDECVMCLHELLD